MSNRMARTESLRSAPVKTELEHSAWGDTMVLDTPADICDRDRKSTRLNSSHSQISYAVFCLKKKKENSHTVRPRRTAAPTASYPCSGSATTHPCARIRHDTSTALTRAPCRLYPVRPPRSSSY